MRNSFILFTLALFLLVSCTSQKEPWRDLIGDNLDQWEQLNGEAKYEIRDGAIVGSTVMPSPNSFLCTKEKFSDFILEFDVLVDSVMNSGVQIRSESRADYNNGRVHGYQVELDPAPRAWSGGIYDEARRLWLYPLDRNQPARKAFVNNQWNHFRVEAIGNSIRTWCNGIPCSDLIDEMTPEGFIGLQVHGIGRDSTKIGKEVIWKNIRIITEEPELYASAQNYEIPQNSYLVNKLSEKEIKDGWKLLWNAEDTSGWKALDGDKFPEKGWLIENGELRLEKKGGSIVTEEKYKNFELILDFKYEANGNSGIKYFIDNENDKKEGSGIGCEFQILDYRNPDNDIESHRIGALYDIIAPIEPRNNGAGNWNRARIVVDGNNVEHWLNNQLTLQYERGGEEWRELVAGSKFKDIESFGEAETGRIMLQDHGHPISFRTIKIKEL